MVIELDIAKSWFQADWIDAEGIQHVKKLTRLKVLPWLAGIAAPALVVMEACASAQHWAREIAKLGPSGGPGRHGARRGTGIEAVSARPESDGRCRGSDRAGG